MAVVLETPEIRKIDFNNVCLACLSRDCLGSVLMINFEGAALPSLLEDTLNFHVGVDDALPKNICKKCVAEVVQFYVFKKRFNETQKTLQTVLAEKNDKVVSSNGQFPRCDEAVRESVVEKEHFVLSSDSEDDALRDTYGIPKDLDIVFVDFKAVKKELSDEGFALNHLKQDGEVETVVCTCEGTYQCLYHKLEVLETIVKKTTPKIIKDKKQKIPLPKPKLFKCNICDKILNLVGKKKHLRTHMGTTKEKTHVCQICSRAFHLRSNLRKHLKTHTGEKPYVCEFCGGKFSEEWTLKAHILRHTGEKPYVCEYCGKGFINKANLKIHQLNHRNKFCSKGVLQEESFKQNRHLEEKSFACTYCNKRYDNMSALRNHLQTHSTQSNTQCAICNKVFLTKARLQTHLLYHGDKQFSCTFCDKKFYTKGQLTTHKRVHTGEKPYVCKYCGQAFAFLGSFKLHTYIHTGEKPHKCKICDKAFAQNHHLKRHILLHTGEKPFSCPHCDKKSRSKFDMECHIRIHTGEKPFKCDICCKAFRNPIYLGRHKRKDH